MARIVVERREDAFHGLQDIVLSAHVQECLLLSGERGVGHVLRGRGGADGERAVGKPAAERSISLADFDAEVIGEPGLQDRRPDLPPRAGQRGDILDVERGELFAHARLKPGGLDERMKGVGRGGEPVRDQDTDPGQLSEHLAQRGVLAADLRKVGHPDLAEPLDVFPHRGSPLPYYRSG